MDFGAFVEIAPGAEGLVHISQFADFRIDKVDDIVKVGDVIPVVIVNIDEQGRINLSAKDAGFKAPRSAASNGVGGGGAVARGRVGGDNRRSGFRDSRGSRDSKPKRGFLKRR